MLSEAAVQELLTPFGLHLTSAQVSQLLTYLDLLLRWNRKINLTAIEKPEDCVKRHFAESLYLARWVALNDDLLDIGSGAGFPGLALKIAFPELKTTLLEPVAKKRAFLKEVARACGIGSVEVRADRLEGFVRQVPLPSFANATSRAVGDLERLVPLATRCLKPGSRLILWSSRPQAKTLFGFGDYIKWASPIAVPNTREREIWIGTVTGGLTDRA